ncbi:MAG: FAD-dependent oxidoreductase, partial [Candidatus Dadabacteria bacterium]|nr:FAD-dependent oxidoreductase [Candidatus Dadabacteria bacterium]NIQ14732.1 FAD-dependent oxidoreductase [Candidatus Dadabacteria bacterium]
SQMINKVVLSEGLDLKLQTELKEIVENGNGRVKGIITNSDEFIECGFVGLTPGVSPNIDLVSDSQINTGRGVLVDWSFRTNIDDIFAAGDCAEIVTEGEQGNIIQQVWYTGKMQGRIAGEVITGRDSVYRISTWYNSAKFFDLEYQTYGKVSNVPVEGEENLYWEHPNNLHSIRIVAKEGKVIGINVMGIRYRHKVCEMWIEEEKTLEYVLENLGEANFDPEFSDKFGELIVSSLKEQAA